MSTRKQESTKPSSADRQQLQSVTRAFDLLRVLTLDPTPLTVAELAARIGLDRTVVLRIVRTLRAEQMVEATASGYKLGPRAFALGSAYSDNLELRQTALPYLAELLRHTSKQQLQAMLTIPVGDEIYIIERAWNPRMRLDLIFPHGSRWPIDGSASGHAMLCLMSDAEIANLLGPERAQKVGPALAQTRTRGFGHFLSPGQPENSAIATAIQTRSGQVVGALVVAGLLDDEEIRSGSKLAAQLRQHAVNIGRVL